MRINYYWNNLAHSYPSDFTLEDLRSMVEVVQEGLQKKYGEIRIKFAFFKDENHRPRLTACYIDRGDEGVAVGLAFCSSTDNPNKHFGRALAFKRAINALQRRGLEMRENCIVASNFGAFLNANFNATVDQKSFWAAPGFTLGHYLSTTTV